MNLFDLCYSIKCVYNKYLGETEVQVPVIFKAYSLLFIQTL